MANSLSSITPIAVLVVLMGCGTDATPDAVGGVDAGHMDTGSDSQPAADAGADVPRVDVPVPPLPDAGADAGLGACEAASERMGDPFAAGEGTEDAPFLICTAQQFDNIRTAPTERFLIGNDIDFSGFTLVPIEEFRGTLNGNGHTFANINLRSEEATPLSLFGGIWGQVSDLTLSGIQVSALSLATGLATINYGTISRVSVNGTASSRDGAASLIVGVNNGMIEDSEAAGTVTSSGNAGGAVVACGSDGQIVRTRADVHVTGDDSVGGLVGSNRGVVESSSASGVVEATGTSVGGLVGTNFYGEIFRSFATGDVSSLESGVGGLCGSMSHESRIENSFATGRATGAENVGGLLGSNNQDGDILRRSVVSNSYATGFVDSAGTRVGGLAGRVEDSTVHPTCYWDVVSTGRRTSAGSLMTRGKSPAEMSMQSTYEGWDFDAVWFPPAGGPPLLRP